MTYYTYLKQFLPTGLKNALVSIILFFLGQYVWWQIFPYKTAELSEPMTVLNENNEVKAGDRLQLEFTFTKYSNVTPVVSRNIFCEDGTVHFPVSEGVFGPARPIGTFTAQPTFGLHEDIPIDTKCMFQFTNEYKVNPVRTITKVWRSEAFKVVKE